MFIKYQKSSLNPITLNTIGFGILPLILSSYNLWKSTDRMLERRELRALTDNHETVMAEPYFRQEIIESKNMFLSQAILLFTLSTCFFYEDSKITWKVIKACVIGTPISFVFGQDETNSSFSTVVCTFGAAAAYTAAKLRLS